MTQQDLGLNLSTRRTRKAVFLDGMNLIVWTELLSLIAHYPPRAKTGRPPFEIATMLRIDFLQQWFAMGAILDKLGHVKTRIRAMVERPFRVINRQFGQMKVCYRGAKNTAQLHTLFVLSYLWIAWRRLLKVL